MTKHNIHFLLNTIKEFSECIDKQVSCIITDKDDNVLSMGWNQVEACDKNCHNKKNRICTTVHAEIVAMGSLNDRMKKEAVKAHVSLFPCKPCQQFLKDNGVTEIISYTANHKGLIPDMAITFPKNINDLLLDRSGVDTLNKINYTSTDMGKVTTTLDSLIRAICSEDFSFISDNLILVELQLEQLKLMLWSKNTEFYNELRKNREQYRKHVLNNL